MHIFRSLLTADIKSLKNSQVIGLWKETHMSILFFFFLHLFDVKNKQTKKSDLTTNLPANQKKLICFVTTVPSEQGRRFVFDIGGDVKAARTGPSVSGRFLHL